jgi:hypothetical protein
MVKSQRIFLAALVGVSIAASLLLSSPAFSATCAAMTNNCIKNNTAPDKVAKCTAAGESCSKSNVFVGPYNGKSFPVTGKSGGCRTYARNRACY